MLLVVISLPLDRRSLRWSVWTKGLVQGAIMRARHVDHHAGPVIGAWRGEC